jgi:hypothetical protein
MMRKGGYVEAFKLPSLHHRRHKVRIDQILDNENQASETVPANSRGVGPLPAKEPQEQQS